MELDFEEISEDELEEESKVKGLGDALGVDWASLIAESRPRPKPISSAKLRWESHNVLVNLGVSVKLAGKLSQQESYFSCDFHTSDVSNSCQSENMVYFKIQHNIHTE